MSLSYPVTLLLLLLTASEVIVHAQPLQLHGAYAARIPEHKCHKQMEWRKCHKQRCFQECSKEPFGVGGCIGTLCSCTYYCKQPPQ